MLFTSESSAALSSGKKLFWLVFRFLVLVFTLLLPLGVVSSILQNGGEIGGRITLFVFLFAPVAVIFSQSLFYPLLIRKRLIIRVLAVIIAMLVFWWENALFPVTYFFPQVLALLMFDLMCVLGCFWLVIPLGERIRDIMFSWLMRYKSPEMIADVARNVPANVTSGLKTGFLMYVARIGYMLVLFIFAFVINSFGLSVWGVGSIEVQSSFNDKEAFQKAVKQRFFNVELPVGIEIESYTRFPLLSFCKESLPSEVGSKLDYRGVDEELAFRGKNGNQISLAVIPKLGRIAIDSNFDTENVNGIDVLRLSRAYYLVHYPGYLSLLEQGVKQPSMIQARIDNDSNKIWLRKNDILVCGLTDQEKDGFESILENFRF